MENAKKMKLPELSWSEILSGQKPIYILKGMVFGRECIILFLIVTFCMFSLCGWAKKPKSAPDAISGKAGDFKISSFGGNDSADWQLQGITADIKDDRVDLKNVKIKSQSEGSSVSISAGNGVVRKCSDVGTFQKDVLVTCDDGTTLATDKIDWFFKNQTARTKENVVVQNGDISIKAEGGRLKKGSNQIMLDKNVSMSTSGGTTIKCKGPLTMDYKKNIAVFNRNVSIDSPSGSMTGRRMVVFFDPAKRVVKRVEAQGDVHLKRGNCLSVSEKAIYFAQEGKAILLGNPKVYVTPQEARSMNNKQFSKKAD